MSISTTARVTVAPTRRQLLAEAIARVPSQQLLSLAAPVEQTGAMSAGSLLADVEARTNALASDRAVLETLKVVAPGLLDRSYALLAQSAELERAGNASGALMLATQAETHLLDGIGTAAGHLARVERTESATALRDALDAIGCRTTVAHEATGDGIWAERGDQVIAVLVEDGGRVTLDAAGCEGGSCVPLHRELEQALAAQGGAFDVVAIDEHRDPRGGGLIQRAGTLTLEGVEPARAVVLQSSSGGRFARAVGVRSANGARQRQASEKRVRGG